MNSDERQSPAEHGRAGDAARSHSPQEPSPPQDTESALEAVLGRGLVYARDGAVVYESIIASWYPDIDIPLLCDLFADNLGDHRAVIAEYLQTAEPPPALTATAAL